MGTNMSDLGLVTIFIPMRQHSLFRDFQLEFWKDFPCKVVIIDDKTITIFALGQLIHQEETNIHMDLQDRLEKAIYFLDTTYFLWLGEDDLVDIHFFEKAISSLKLKARQNNSEKFAIYSSPREFNFRFLYHKYGHKEYKNRFSTLQESAIARAISMLNRPIDRHFYAIQETVVVKKVFRALTSGTRLPNTLWYRMFPSFFELGCTLLQKTSSDQNIWYLKGNRRFFIQKSEGKPTSDESQSTDLQELFQENRCELEFWFNSFAKLLSQGEIIREEEIQSLCKLLGILIVERDANASTQKKLVMSKIKNEVVKAKSFGPKFLPEKLRSRLYLAAKIIFGLYEFVFPLKKPWSLVLGRRHSKLKKAIIRFRRF